MDFEIFSFVGLFFAIIYRIPQIVKIYRTKQADALSSYSYITHNGAYVSFICYLIGTGKTDQWVLCFYYFMGISQNLLIFAMKTYYERQQQQSSRIGSAGARPLSVLPVERMSVVDSTTRSNKQLSPSFVRMPVAPAGEGTGHSRQIYAQRRLWFKMNRLDGEKTA